MYEFPETYPFFSSSGWMTDHGTDDEDEAMELDESQALPVTR